MAVVGAVVEGVDGPAEQRGQLPRGGPRGARERRDAMLLRDQRRRGSRQVERFAGADRQGERVERLGRGGQQLADPGAFGAALQGPAARVGERGQRRTHRLGQAPQAAQLGRAVAVLPRGQLGGAAGGDQRRRVDGVVGSSRNWRA